MKKTTKSKIEPIIKSIILPLPGGKYLIEKGLYFLAKKRLAKFGETKQIFKHYYTNNTWGSSESLSGPGSTIRYTENIRRKIPQLFKEIDVNVILDAPCGDYNWFKLIKWHREITYIGGDIVEALIQRNQTLYGNQNRSFINLDIVRDPLPKADLWLCRDCLFHLSKRDIMLTIDNFLRSDIRYLLTSTHPNCDINCDLPTGSARLLNLELPPFSFTNPIRKINDWIDNYPVRILGLWERKELQPVLTLNQKFQRELKKHR